MGTEFLLGTSYFYTAVPFHKMVGNDDLGGHKVGVLDVVNHLRSSLNPQLEGIDINGSQLW